MRTLRSTLMGAVILGLLASPSIAVAAQVEGEMPTVAYVTGRVITDTSPKDDWEETRTDEGPDAIVVHVLGWRVERSIDWNDPRLPSEMVSRTNMDMHISRDDSVQVFAESLRLDGPDGAWTGTGHAVVIEHGHGAESLIILTGEGAYEGLSAVLVTESVRADPELDENDYTLYRGYIFEGEMPPMPGPIEPSATALAVE